MRNIAHGRGDSFPLFTKLLALSNKHSARPKGREGKWKKAKRTQRFSALFLFAVSPLPLFRKFLQRLLF